MLFININNSKIRIKIFIKKYKDKKITELQENFVDSAAE
jgi:hypothetical protein